MNVYQVLKRPILTEKMLKLQENKRQYAFEVDGRANKIEVEKAVHDKFDVTVENVNIVNVKGKTFSYSNKIIITR